MLGYLLGIMGRHSHLPHVTKMETTICRQAMENELGKTAVNSNGKVQTRNVTIFLLQRTG
jgi:hypothetical protein